MPFSIALILSLSKDARYGCSHTRESRGKAGNLRQIPGNALQKANTSWANLVATEDRDQLLEDRMSGSTFPILGILAAALLLGFLVLAWTDEVLLWSRLLRAVWSALRRWIARNGQGGGQV
jgi:hypothetical protein